MKRLDQSFLRQTFELKDSAMPYIRSVPSWSTKRTDQA